MNYQKKKADEDYVIGTIQEFAGNFVPDAFLSCDGRLLPISKWNALYSVIGFTYGGDGMNNFALPAMQGKYICVAGIYPKGWKPLEWQSDAPLTITERDGRTLSLAWSGVPDGRIDYYNLKVSGSQEKIIRISSSDTSTEYVANAGDNVEISIIPIAPDGNAGQESNVVEINIPALAGWSLDNPLSVERNGLDVIATIIASDSGDDDGVEYVFIVNDAEFVSPNLSHTYTAEASEYVEISVLVRSSVGSGNRSNTETVSVPSTPSAPTLTSSRSGTTLTFNWTASSSVDAVSYQLYAGSTRLYSGTGRSFSKSHPAGSTLSNLKVVSISAVGSSNSNTIPSVSVPALPSASTLTSSRNGTTFTFNWTASSSVDPINYELYTGSTLLYSGTGRSFSKSYAAGTTLSNLKVVATSAVGSANSNMISSLSVPAKPTWAVPNSAITSSVNEKEITWNWNKTNQGDSITGWKVYVDGSFVKTVPSTTLTHTLTTEYSKTHKLYVIPTSNVGDGDPSPTATAQTPGPLPATIAGPSVSFSNDGRFHVNWGASVNASSYELELTRATTIYHTTTSTSHSINYDNSRRIIVRVRGISPDGRKGEWSAQGYKNI